MQKLKCISLYQPYATLCVIGAKGFETRSWDTYFRGTVGIHATASMPLWCKELLDTEPFRSDLRGIDLTKGAVLGTVEIISTHRTDVWLADRNESDTLTCVLSPASYREYCYGNYGGGRFAWELANPILFDEPIPAKGSQGFWFLNT